MVQHPGARFLAQGLRAVGTAGVHDDDLIGERATGKQVADTIRLVFRDYGHADLGLFHAIPRSG
jgi:hypothetical protein